MFLESKGLSFNGDELAAVDESIDERDNGGGVGKDFSPLAKHLIGGDQQRAFEVAAGDDLEEQVGVAGVIGEIAELVEDEQLWLAEDSELALQACRSVLVGEGIEHFGGGEEADGGAGEDGLMSEIAGDERLADAVGSDEDDVGSGVEPFESEEIFDLIAIDLGGPGPVEIGERFEGADACPAQPSFEASFCALLLFPGEKLRQPGLASLQ